MNLFLPILEAWFNKHHCYGAVVYQRPNGKRVAVMAETQEDFVRLLRKPGMPFTAMPSDEWQDAIRVDSAVTIKDAIRILEQ